MTTETKWLDRLRQLHPLLTPPPRRSDWAARQAEIDAASKLDQEAARKAREAAARQVERDYDNDSTTWAAIAVIIVVAALSLWVAFRLIAESRLEDCLIAHQHNCDTLLE
ncbi:MAG: hypothetical protein ACLQJR_32805 [Stellaceae bacterium]